MEFAQPCLVADYSSSSESEDETKIHCVINTAKDKTSKDCVTNTANDYTSKDCVNNINKTNDNASPRDSELPVPSSLLSMFGSRESRLEDQSALHGGRQRSFPHDKNNWATYVYIDTEDCGLGEVQDLLVSKYNLEKVDSSHLSLSKVVSLRHHWIQPFTDGLRDRLADQGQFFLVLDDVEVFVNEERTRTFIGLTASANLTALTSLTAAVDLCLKEFGLATFYRQPSFHTSLGWCLGDQEKRMKSLLLDMREDVKEMLEEDPDIGRMKVDTVCCKSGNKVFRISLTDEQRVK